MAAAAGRIEPVINTDEKSEQGARPVKRPESEYRWQT